MNKQLISMGFQKLAEACSVFSEAFSGESDEQSAGSDLADSPANGPANPKAAPKEKKEGRKSTAPKAAPKTKAPVEDEAEEQDETEAEGEEQTEADDFEGLEDEAPAKVTRDQLRKNIVEYAKKHGKAKAYELLEKFGKSKNVDGIKEELLEKVAAQIDKGLK